MQFAQGHGGTLFFSRVHSAAITNCSFSHSIAAGALDAVQAHTRMNSFMRLCSACTHTCHTHTCIQARVGRIYTIHTVKRRGAVLRGGGQLGTGRQLVLTLHLQSAHTPCAHLHACTHAGLRACSNADECTRVRMCAPKQLSKQWRAHMPGCAVPHHCTTPLHMHRLVHAPPPLPAPSKKQTP